MDINFTGIIVAVVTFLIIGLFHPVVIKAEYYWGVKCWWVFMLLGVISLAVSLFITNFIVSMIFGVLGVSLLWCIIEIFDQRKRVEKGWFPDNPNRKR